MNLFLRGLEVILALAFVWLLYLVTGWLLGMLGFSVPEQIMKVIFIILGLLAVIGALSGKITWPWRA